MPLLYEKSCLLNSGSYTCNSHDQFVTLEEEVSILTSDMVVFFVNIITNIQQPNVYKKNVCLKHAWIQTAYKSCNVTLAHCHCQCAYWQEYKVDFGIVFGILY